MANKPQTLNSAVGQHGHVEVAVPQHDLETAAGVGAEPNMEEKNAEIVDVTAETVYDQDGDVMMSHSPEIDEQYRHLSIIVGQTPPVSPDVELSPIPMPPLERIDSPDPALADFDFVPTASASPVDVPICSFCYGIGCPNCRDLDEDDYENTRLIIRDYFSDITAVFEAYLARHHNRMMHMLNGNIVHEKKEREMKEKEKFSSKSKAAKSRVTRTNNAVLKQMADMAIENNAMRDTLKQIVAEQKDKEAEKKEERDKTTALDRACKMPKEFAIYSFSMPAILPKIAMIIMLVLITLCIFLSDVKTNCRETISEGLGLINKYILPSSLQIVATPTCTETIIYPFRYLILVQTAFLCLYFLINFNFCYIKYKTTGLKQCVDDLPCLDQAMIKDLRKDYWVQYKITSLSKFRWSTNLVWVSAENTYEVLKKRLNVVEMDFDLSHRTIELNNGIINPASAENVQHNTALFCVDTQLYLLQKSPRFQYAPAIVPKLLLVINELALIYSCTVISFQMCKVTCLFFQKWIWVTVLELLHELMVVCVPSYNGHWAATLWVLLYLFLIPIILLILTGATAKELPNAYILIVSKVCELSVTLLMSCLIPILIVCQGMWTFLLERGSIIQDILFGESEKLQMLASKPTLSSEPATTYYDSFPSLRATSNSSTIGASAPVETFSRGLSGPWSRPLNMSSTLVPGSLSMFQSTNAQDIYSTGSIATDLPMWQPTTRVSKLFSVEK